LTEELEVLRIVAERLEPAERDRWFAFRGERVREAARDWLVDHRIEPTTAPGQGT
jgi:hypothetical protein